MPAISLQDLARQVVGTLIAAGRTVATAESLTAGLVAATLTDVPGASAVLRGGLIVYATDLKHRLAGVEAGLLADHGPVHPEVARQLADGARRACVADLGIGLTGVAGPGPADGHPAGTVFVAVSSVDAAGRPYYSERHLTRAGDRATIRAAAVGAALDLLLTHSPR